MVDVGSRTTFVSQSLTLHVADVHTDMYIRIGITELATTVVNNASAGTNNGTSYR